MLQEGIFTIFNEIDEMKSGLNAMLKPNGSQQAPARSCYDLFLCNPSFEAGELNYIFFLEPVQVVFRQSFSHGLQKQRFLPTESLLGPIENFTLHFTKRINISVLIRGGIDSSYL